MFRVTFAPEAINELQSLRAFHPKQVIAGIESQLVPEPIRETRHRKRLRPNQLAEWEVRVGKFRIFYDVSPDDEVVRVIAIGHKQGNALFIRGEQFEL